MNIANMTRLRDKIASLTETGDDGLRFTMQSYLRVGDDDYANLAELLDEQGARDVASCGAAACLAGWCQIIGATGREELGDNVWSFATDWLDLGVDEADRLFLGLWSDRELDDITAADAVAHLDGLLAAGTDANPPRPPCLGELPE